MNSKLKSLLHSFRYALLGVRHCIRKERNFRVHMVAAAYVIALGVLLELDSLRFTVLILTISIVLVMEMLNTAVESLVDLASPTLHPLAKTAKDVAAGAVFVSAVVSVAVGCLLLWQPDRLISLAETLLRSPIGCIALATSLAAAAFFIFGIQEKQR